MSHEMIGLVLRSLVGAVFLAVVYFILSFGTSLWYLLGAAAVFIVGFGYIFEIVVLLVIMPIMHFKGK